MKKGVRGAAKMFLARKKWDGEEIFQGTACWVF